MAKWTCGNISTVLRNKAWIIFFFSKFYMQMMKHCVGTRAPPVAIKRKWHRKRKKKGNKFVWNAIKNYMKQMNSDRVKCKQFPSKMWYKIKVHVKSRRIRITLFTYQRDEFSGNGSSTILVSILYDTTSYGNNKTNNNKNWVEKNVCFC